MAAARQPQRAAVLLGAAEAIRDRAGTLPLQERVDIGSSDRTPLSVRSVGRPSPGMQQGPANELHEAADYALSGGPVGGISWPPTVEIGSVALPMPARRLFVHRSSPSSGRRDRVAGYGRPALPPSKGTTVPSQDPHKRGLLARLDALVELAADRHGLALLPGGRLAAAEARMAARVTGLAPTRGPSARASGVTQREAVELLRAVAEGVGLLRVRGDRLEASSLRHAWAQIDESLRAGLAYAAWCQQVTLTGCRHAVEEAGVPGKPVDASHPGTLWPLASSVFLSVLRLAATAALTLEVARGARSRTAPEADSRSTTLISWVPSPTGASR